jgi:hypothetical protein
VLRTSFKRLTTAALAVGVIITGVTAMSGGAGAYGGEAGELLIKGPGTAYTTGAEPYVALENTAGSTNTFGLEVKNTGAATAQFNIRLNNQSFTCAPGCPTPAVVISQGGLNATPLVLGSNGYFTAPIAPGKTIAYTLKVTIPKGLIGSGSIYTILELDDTAHTVISYGFFVSNVTQTKGTTGNEEFVAGSSGQKPLSYSNTLPDYVTNAAVKLGATSVFTVKLQNDSTTAAQVQYHLVDGSNCAAYFPATVKAGTTDITSLALSGNYVSPLLAPGKNVSLTVTVKYVATPLNCTGSTDVWQSQTVGTGGETVYLGTNAIAS